MLGGAGKTPSLQRPIVTKGQEPATPASGSSGAREMPQVYQPSSPRLFKTQDLLCNMNVGGGPIITSKTSSESSNASPPNPTWVPPPRARRLSGRVPSRPHCPGVLEGAGPWKEAVTRTPWEPGYRASRVGEFKESEDWSPLLLLLR